MNVPGSETNRIVGSEKARRLGCTAKSSVLDSPGVTGSDADPTSLAVGPSDRRDVVVDVELDDVDAGSLTRVGDLHGDRGRVRRGVARHHVHEPSLERGEREAVAEGNRGVVSLSE